MQLSYLQRGRRDSDQNKTRQYAMENILKSQELYIKDLEKKLVENNDPRKRSRKDEPRNEKENDKTPKKIGQKQIKALGETGMTIQGGGTKKRVSQDLEEEGSNDFENSNKKEKAEVVEPPKPHWMIEEVETLKNSLNEFKSSMDQDRKLIKEFAEKATLIEKTHQKTEEIQRLIESPPRNYLYKTGPTSSIYGNGASASSSPFRRLEYESLARTKQEKNEDELEMEEEEGKSEEENRDARVGRRHDDERKFQEIEDFYQNRLFHLEIEKNKLLEEVVNLRKGGSINAKVPKELGEVKKVIVGTFDEINRLKATKESLISQQMSLMREQNARLLDDNKEQLRLLRSENESFRLKIAELTSSDGMKSGPDQLLGTHVKETKAKLQELVSSIVAERDRQVGVSTDYLSRIDKFMEESLEKEKLWVLEKNSLMQQFKKIQDAVEPRLQMVQEQIERIQKDKEDFEREKHAENLAIRTEKALLEKSIQELTMIAGAQEKKMAEEIKRLSGVRDNLLNLSTNKDELLEAELENLRSDLNKIQVAFEEREKLFTGTLQRSTADFGRIYEGILKVERRSLSDSIKFDIKSEVEKRQNQILDKIRQASEYLGANVFRQNEVYQDALKRSIFEMEKYFGSKSDLLEQLEKHQETSSKFLAMSEAVMKRIEEIHREDEKYKITKEELKKLENKLGSVLHPKELMYQNEILKYQEKVMDCETELELARQVISRHSLKIEQLEKMIGASIQQGKVWTMNNEISRLKNDISSVTEQNEELLGFQQRNKEIYESNFKKINAKIEAFSQASMEGFALAEKLYVMLKRGESPPSSSRQGASFKDSSEKMELVENMKKIAQQNFDLLSKQLNTLNILIGTSRSEEFKYLMSELNLVKNRNVEMENLFKMSIDKFNKMAEGIIARPPDAISQISEIKEMMSQEFELFKIARRQLEEKESTREEAVKELREQINRTVELQERHRNLMLESENHAVAAIKNELEAANLKLKDEQKCFTREMQSVQGRHAETVRVLQMKLENALKANERLRKKSEEEMKKAETMKKEFMQELKETRAAFNKAQGLANERVIKTMNEKKLLKEEIQSIKLDTTKMKEDSLISRIDRGMEMVLKCLGEREKTILEVKKEFKREMGNMAKGERERIKALEESNTKLRNEMKQVLGNFQTIERTEKKEEESLNEIVETLKKTHATFEESIEEIKGSYMAAEKNYFDLYKARESQLIEENKLLRTKLMRLEEIAENALD